MDQTELSNRVKEIGKFALGKFDENGMSFQEKIILLGDASALLSTLAISCFFGDGNELALTQQYLFALGRSIDEKCSHQKKYAGEPANMPFQ